MLDGTWKGVDGDNNEWTFDLERNGARVVGTFHVHWVDAEIEGQLLGWYHTGKADFESIVFYMDFEYENTDIECDYTSWPNDDDTLDGRLDCRSDGEHWQRGMTVTRS